MAEQISLSTDSGPYVVFPASLGASEGFVGTISLNGMTLHRFRGQQESVNTNAFQYWLLPGSNTLQVEGTYTTESSDPALVVRINGMNAELLKSSGGNPFEAKNLATIEVLGQDDINSSFEFQLGPEHAAVVHQLFQDYVTVDQLSDADQEQLRAALQRTARVYKTFESEPEESRKTYLEDRKLLIEESMALHGRTKDQAESQLYESMVAMLFEMAKVKPQDLQLGDLTEVEFELAGRYFWIPQVKGEGPWAGFSSEQFGQIALPTPHFIKSKSGAWQVFRDLR